MNSICNFFCWLKPAFRGLVFQMVAAGFELGISPSRVGLAGYGATLADGYLRVWNLKDVTSHAF